MRQGLFEINLTRTYDFFSTNKKQFSNNTVEQHEQHEQRTTNNKNHPASEPGHYVYKTNYKSGIQ